MTHQTSASPIVSSRMSKIPARVIIIAAIFVVAGGAYSVERYRISGALRNAEVFVLAGEHKEAEKTLRMVLRRHPNSFAVRMALAETLIADANAKGGDRALAARARETLAYMPKRQYDETFYRVLGEAYVAEARYQTALSYFEKSLSIDSDNPETLLRVAETLDELGDYDSAFSVRTRAETLVSDDTKGDVASALYTQLAAVAIVGRKYDEAETLLKKAEASADGRDARFAALVGFARLELAKGKGTFESAKKAMEYYQKMLASDPEYVPAHVNIAGLFLRINDVGEARKHIQIVSGSDDPEALFVAAQVLFKEKKYTEALTVLQFAASRLDAMQNERNSQEKRVLAAKIFLETALVESSVKNIRNAEIAIQNAEREQAVYTTYQIVNSWRFLPLLNLITTAK